MTPILLDFARKSGFTLCKEESALREMLEQFAKFIIEHEASKQPEHELIGWATAVGSHAHVSWGKDRPDYPIRYEVPLYTTPPAQPAPVQDVDWKDQYEKQKRRAEMWVAKYEKDIGPLEKAAPAAQRQWVGLTEEELQKILQEVSGQGWKSMLEAIEAKLKEKNT